MVITIRDSLNSCSNSIKLAVKTFLVYLLKIPSIQFQGSGKLHTTKANK